MCIPRSSRTIDLQSLAPNGRVQVNGLAKIAYGPQADPRCVIDLSAVEQLVEAGQTQAIADALRYLSRSAQPGSLRALLEVLEARLDREGLDAICPRDRPFFGGYARPRRFEIAAAINRWRGLRVQPSAKRERE